MDIVDTQTRSRMMPICKGKNTIPEMQVRRWLHAQGFRYSLHANGLSGKPDLVLKKRNLVVFVHGCFWHCHEGCYLASNPMTRVEFWTEKFEKNIIRDRNNYLQLLNQCWRVAIVWECGLRKRRDEDALPALVRWIKNGEIRFESKPAR